MERKDILIIAALIRKIVREEITNALSASSSVTETTKPRPIDKFKEEPPRQKVYATTPNIRAIAELVSEDEELDDSVDISMFMEHQHKFDKIINAKVTG